MHMPGRQARARLMPRWFHQQREARGHFPMGAGDWWMCNSVLQHAAGQTEACLRPPGGAPPVCRTPLTGCGTTGTTTVTATHRSTPTVSSCLVPLLLPPRH